MGSFAENLKTIRESRGLTQTALADLIGTTKQVLSRYESGERVPKISMVQKIATALNVPMSALSGESRLTFKPVFKLDIFGEQSRPDLNRAATVAAQTLINSRVSACPVDPMSILRDMPGVFVVTFTEFVGESGLLDETVTAFGSGSQDAITYTLDGPTRVVAYNQRLPHYMLQVALARELGFIVLGHEDAEHTQAQVSEALYFARHLLCPRPLIRALQDAGVSLTVETVGNLTGCYGRILAGIRKTPGAMVAASTNRQLRRQLDPYAVRCVSLLAALSRDDDSGPAKFGSYMDNYQE